MRIANDAAVIGERRGEQGERYPAAAGCRRVSTRSDIFLVWRLARVLPLFRCGLDLSLSLRCVSGEESRRGERRARDGAVINRSSGDCDVDPRPNHSGQPIIHTLLCLCPCSVNNFILFTI